MGLLQVPRKLEKVPNVPSILRVRVLMFLNVECLGGDIFTVKSGNSVDLSSMVKIIEETGFIPNEEPQTI